MDIKELRKSKQMTQAAFAEALGVKESSIAAVETGRRKLTEEIRAKAKEVFGVEIDAEVVKAPAKKTAAKGKKTAVKKETPAKKGLVIQSPLGGEITPEEIVAKIAEATKGTGVGKPDAIYVRVDENKAFWVKGKKNGNINLW